MSLCVLPPGCSPLVLPPSQEVVVLECCSAWLNTATRKSSYIQSHAKYFQEVCYIRMPHVLTCAFYAFIALYYASDRLQQNKFSGVSD